MKIKFFRCRHCGNVAIKLVDSNVPMVCCGEKMEELEAGSVDASIEKHVPVVERLDEHRIRVKVGSAPHPMLPEHHISFIVHQTEKGFQVAYPQGEAVADFYTDEEPTAVYEYCNLHGLWKK